MLLFLLALLTPSFLLVSSEECDIGPKVDVHFDMNKFVGNWYYVFHTPNQGEASLGCIKDRFTPEENGVFHMTTTAYDKTKNSFNNYDGKVEHWTDDTFLNDYDNDVYWDANYGIRGVDYTKYAIITACLKGEDKPFTWIGFRSKNPSEEDIKAAFEELDKNGGNSKALEKFPSCDKME
ncbi:apolipoprotein D-like [Periplaneta americana]|uniref:apolipoprotein D-like n=1 Tax=Periplaneta americana TaxID=6978 RepID=UPI0037E98837